MNTITYETIQVEKHGRVAVLTLNRPHAMHAINMQMRSELRQALDALRRDAEVGAVVLTGSGDKAFSAGMDLREFAKTNADVPVAEMKRYRWRTTKALPRLISPSLRQSMVWRLAAGWSLRCCVTSLLQRKTRHLHLAKSSVD